MQNFILYSGKSKDVKLAQKLSELCVQEIEVKQTVEVFDSSKDKFAASENKILVPYCGGEAQAENTVTYSVNSDKGDICGLNFQERETSKSLEILSGSFMGRVNIPTGSEFTRESVLICAAAFFAAGKNLREILQVINRNIR